MSVDDRLRAGLAWSAVTVELDVGPRLTDALVRGRRRRKEVRARRIVISATAGLSLVALCWPLLSPHVRDSDRSVATAGADSNYLAIAGSYRATVESDTALVRTNGMVGSWTLTFSARGRVRVKPPAGFVGSASAAPFTVDGSHLRTNVSLGGLCLGPAGLYEYGISRGRLRLVAINDACVLRKALLAARQWGRVSGNATGGTLPTSGPFLPDDGSVLLPGQYTAEFRPHLEIDPPPGWTGNADTSDWVDIRHGSGDTAGVLSLFRIASVFDPATGRASKLPPDLVSWFTAHPWLRVVTLPRRTTVGGHAATTLELTLAPRLKCPGDGCGFAPLQPGEPGFGWSTSAAPRLRARLYLIRIPGAWVVVQFSAGHARFNAEAKAAGAAISTMRLD